MSVEAITITMGGSLILGLFLGVPLAFLLGGIGVVLTYFLWGSSGLFMVASRAFEWSTNPVILAIPLFIIMGLLLQHGGIVEDLYEMMHRWSGRLRGGLAMGTVAICTLMAAMTGNTAAATVTMSIIALPSMIRRNYDKKLAVGCIAAGGTLGILIPPSVMFVILGLSTGLPVGKLFAGGVMAGLVISALFIIYIGIITFLKPDLAPASPISYSWGEKIISLKAVILPALLVMSVLGSIFLGIATPTEGAAVGAFGALVTFCIYRGINWKVLIEICNTTLKLSSMVLWIVIGASIFITFYSAVGAADFITGLLLATRLGSWGTLILMMIIIFIMGMFLDPAGIILLIAPIFFPIIIELGFDPIWFAVLFVLNLQTGYITPPFGYNLFYIRSVAPPEISMGDIYESIVPYVVLFIFGIGIIVVFPQIATWLPSILI